MQLQLFRICAPCMQVLPNEKNWKVHTCHQLCETLTSNSWFSGGHNMAPAGEGDENERNNHKYIPGHREDSRVPSLSYFDNIFPQI